jgi:Fur family transcriptional regulator, zinc uptake regulator
MSPSQRNVAFRQHDHNRCIDSALNTAKRLCEERGVRLTPLREQVLNLIWQSHKPLGAYAILEALANDPEPGSKPRRQAPPTVYRALEFLQEHGLVHRINSLNAFIGCLHPREHHHSHFLICRECATAVEIFDEAISTAIRNAATAARFVEDSAFVEITGLCPNCRQR